MKGPSDVSLCFVALGPLVFHFYRPILQPINQNCIYAMPFLDGNMAWSEESPWLHQSTQAVIPVWNLWWVWWCLLILTRVKQYSRTGHRYAREWREGELKWMHEFCWRLVRMYKSLTYIPCIEWFESLTGISTVHHHHPKYWQWIAKHGHRKDSYQFSPIDLLTYFKEWLQSMGQLSIQESGAMPIHRLAYLIACHLRFFNGLSICLTFNHYHVFHEYHF